MTFRKNLNRICREKETTLTRMCKDLGISSSKVTAINNGSIPTEEMMLNFSNYLNCSIMDFFIDEDKNDIILNQNNRGNISNNVGSTDNYTTNNYYSGCDTQFINREIPITADSKEFFFRLLDKLRNMEDGHLLEMIKYADFIINRNEDFK